MIQLLSVENVDSSAIRVVVPPQISSEFVSALRGDPIYPFTRTNG